MSHGTPDFGQTAGQVVVYQLTDLAEAVARLGSVVTFDRRGDIVWFEDFEEGLRRWSSTIGGAGAAVDLSMVTARHGLLSARLVPGSTLNRLARIASTVFLPALNRTGLEASFALALSTSIVSLGLIVYTGTRLLAGVIRWDVQNGQHQYLDSVGNPVILATGKSLFIDAKGFHTLKVVIDPLTETYVRAIFDADTYDIDGIPLNAVNDATVPQIQPMILNEGIAGINSTGYVDDAIVTFNEPAQP